MSDSPYGPWEKTDISPSRLKVFMDCPQKYAFSYVEKLPRSNGPASMQGLAMHKLFLEELLGGGIDDKDFLVEMMAEDLKHRLDTDDPRDWKTKLPLNDAEKFDAIRDLRIWGEGLLDAFFNGEDSYGNKFHLPEVAQTEVEGCTEVYLPSLGETIRLRGYIDLLFADGTIGDLKLASDYWKAIWTLARALTELQPAVYAKLADTDYMRYVIVDKKKDRFKGAKPPAVRTIEYKVTEKDMERLIKTLEYFVKASDVLNNHENGVFPPNAVYDGQTKASAGKPELQFCGKMCDYKQVCWERNYSRGTE